ncbi:LacI family DNA-binding transcriptional regulator [Gracilibacillus sp. YIM 98692]|uniref:LacI family DNA-binding transcriptional regulator n=1 Tax=Gracilibacillus sp. YIM 98692 TaxID=2663532 RepID=UPI0013D089BF|nr:LacI family DNA-binding transcriptional regulator [Gracilibacillus sp. YIM 98692]
MKIDDIAKLANVSRSAVSLALNGKSGVSNATREKIINIAKEHGYFPRSIINPNQYFQSNSKILRFVACTNEGIVTEHYDTLPFFVELMNNLKEQTGVNDYSLMVSSLNIEELEEGLLKLENEQQSAGILLLGTNLSAKQIELVSKIQPNLVVLDTYVEMMDINFVVMNNFYGAYQAAKHLIDLGHKDIGYVESNARMYNFDTRKKGVLQAFDDHGIELLNKNIFSVSPTIISSQDTFKEKIKNRLKSLPTAFVCECDYNAISIIKSLTELGVKVPEDVSVIGFDNIFESQVITPELTTINVKKQEIAAIAVNKLISQIEENNDTKYSTIVNTNFIKRNSTKKLK